jgi:hypothetical protein
LSVSQSQLAEVLGCHQTLISVRKRQLAKAPVSPIGKETKRRKRRDAFEVQNQQLVEVIEHVWVSGKKKDELAFYF